MAKSVELRGRGMVKGDGHWRSFMASTEKAVFPEALAVDKEVVDVTTLDPGSLLAAARFRRLKAAVSKVRVGVALAEVAKDAAAAKGADNAGAGSAAKGLGEGTAGDPPVGPATAAAAAGDEAMAAGKGGEDAAKEAGDKAVGRDEGAKVSFSDGRADGGTVITSQPGLGRPPEAMTAPMYELFHGAVVEGEIDVEAEEDENGPLVGPSRFLHVLSCSRANRGF